MQRFEMADMEITRHRDDSKFWLIATVSRVSINILSGLLKHNLEIISGVESIADYYTGGLLSNGGSFGVFADNFSCRNKTCSC